MIEVLRGNILSTDAEALVNTVNCVGVMGKGIALQFKQAFPENFKDYYQACLSGQVIPGRVHVYETGSEGNPKYIINFPTKRHWRGKSSIMDIEAGLTDLVANVKRLGIRSIAVPPLGCGSGGLDWDDVRPRIEAVLSPLLDVNVFLYAPTWTPEPARMPIGTEEPRMTRSRALFIILLDQYRIPDYRLTLLEAQKLAYFLQCAGEPLRLSFVKQRYGPYAENLNHVLQIMEGHFIRGYGDRSREARIFLLPGAREKAKNFIMNQGNGAKERLERVRDTIRGFETPYGMELLATVHWIAFQEDKRAKTDPNIAVEAIRMWSARKRSVFNPDHIREAWQRLQDQRWFAS